jgi:Arm DNA-binding domain
LKGTIDMTDRIYFGTDLPGFGLRVRQRPDGSTYESWVVQCRINGRTRRHKIGDAKLIDAQQARETAATFLAKVQQAKTQRRLCRDMADALLASP